MSCKSRAGNEAMWDWYFNMLLDYIEGEKLTLQSAGLIGTAPDKKYGLTAFVSMDGKYQQLMSVQHQAFNQRCVDAGVTFWKHPSSCSLAVQACDLAVMFKMLHSKIPTVDWQKDNAPIQGREYFMNYIGVQLWKGKGDKDRPTARHLQNYGRLEGGFRAHAQSCCTKSIIQKGFERSLEHFKTSPICSVSYTRRDGSSTNRSKINA